MGQAAVQVPHCIQSFTFSPLNFLIFSIDTIDTFWALIGNVMLLSSLKQLKSSSLIVFDRTPGAVPPGLRTCWGMQKAKDETVSATECSWKNAGFGVKNGPIFPRLSV
jgi:hypothetical protein